MNNNSKNQTARRYTRRRARRRADRRTMVIRRIVAAVLVAGAAGLGVYMYKSGMSFGLAMLLWSMACALLVVEALLLSINQAVSKAIHVLMCSLCVVLLAFGFVDDFYEVIDGRLIPRYKLVTELTVTDKYPYFFDRMDSLRTLDMRGSTVTDFSPIRSHRALERLDIRENYAFNQAEHDILASVLPNCDIRWSVPVAGAHYDSAAKGFDLTSLPLSAGEISTLVDLFPEKGMLYRVPLYGQSYDKDTEALDLTGQIPDIKVIEEALKLLPNVKTVDLRGAKTPAETVATLCDAHPDVRFMFTCDVPGGEMTTEDEEVKVPKSGYEELKAYLAYIDYMPNLKKMDASEVLLSIAQVDEISAANYGMKLRYSVPVFGKLVSSLATELTLDGIKITSLEDVETCIARLPNLRSVSMCECGLSEDQMGVLFDAHPEIKFIWYIYFGHYRLRTDATSFTTGLGESNTYHYKDSTFKALRYCTDLMMLDLGHNEIRSLDNFTSLHKLKVLILADNKLTDVSQITAFPDLEYLELFLNDITDVTPVTELKHLKDFNIFHNPLYENHKVLKSMTWLERLWIGGCRLSTQDLAELKEALPNTKINIEGRSSTGNGWRKHPRYYTILQMYKEERYIPFD